MLDFALKTAGEVFVNCRIEHYPGYKRITVASHPIFKQADWEEIQPRSKAGAAEGEQTKCSPEQRSINRAKKRIYDIAALNDFSYFVTWTLDKSLINRTDSKIISTKLKTFLGNKVRRNNMSYLIVPELHSDKVSIHMHGLLSGAFDLADSSHKTHDGRTIWNMRDWRYGFSTCIELDDERERIANYITKYISKDFRKIFGNFYYAGGGVRRKPPTSYTNIDYDKVAVIPYHVPNSNVELKYLIIREDEKHETTNCIG